MKKTILTALIAATALAPVMASAQDWQGRRGNRDGDNGGQTREAARAERQADRPAPQQQDGNREAFRAQRQAERAAQPQVQQGGDRDAWRAQREAQRAQPQQAPVQVQQPQQQAQRQWNGGQWNGGQANQQVRQDRRDDTRNPRNPRNGTVTPQQYRNDNRDYRNDRRDDRQVNRQDARQDYRRDQNRGGNWNNGNNWNGGNTWNNGSSWNRNDNNGRWNRQWRNDNRYDWQNWRGQNRSAYRLPRYYAPRGYNYGYQRFGIGVTLGSILFSQNYWINDPWDYRLPPAYGPYRWVRYYNDALLVDIDTGEVVDVINDIFW